MPRPDDRGIDNYAFAGTPHQDSQRDGAVQQRCAPGTPAGDAADLADRYLAMGEPAPWPLLEQLLTDCQGVDR